MRRYLAIGGLAALMCALAAAGAGATIAITSPPQTQTDPAGDSGTAPDILGVSVTNDDRGQYRFTISFATPYGSASSSEIFLDTDRNSSTGDPQGAGADFLLYDDRASQDSELDAWGASGWQKASSNSLGVQVGSDQKSITFAIGLADLKGASTFNYFVASYDGSGGDGHFDDAPSGDGTFTYVSRAVFTLSAQAAAVTAAKAGGSWTLAMVAIRSDNDKTVGAEAAVACSGHAGSVKLRVSFKGFISAGGGDSTAVCRLSIPKSLKGKTVSGTITVSDGGQSVTRTVQAKAK